MYEEWNNLKQVNDPNNPFTPCFVLPSGEEFYVEPSFYTQLTNFKEIYSIDDYHRIIQRMNELVIERKKVIFTYDFESPFIHKEGFIYLEFLDITDSLKIMIDDKSRGSDYGD